MGDAMRKMYEIKRPMASETAAISEPALAVLMNASKGWSPPFSLMVMNALPTGVSMLCVLPVNALGRGFLVPCQMGECLGWLLQQARAFSARKRRGLSYPQWLWSPTPPYRANPSHTR
jgi:hypothetical protein